MADNTDLLKQIISRLDEQGKDIKSVKQDIATVKDVQQAQGRVQQEQGKDIKSLKTDVSALKDGQEILELKGEIINANQQRAEEQSQKDHAEIMERLVGMVEIEGKEHKLLERRVERIEKHSNLPPLK